MSRQGTAWLYLGGASALGLLAVGVPPFSLILLWPALSLALVGAAYAGLGPGLFGKTAGRLPWTRRLLLAPYLAGAHLSLRWQTRGAPPYVEVIPGLWLGRRLGPREAAQLSPRAVIDLTAELSETASLRRKTYLNLPVLDLTAPSPSQLDQGVRFITRHLPDGPVYVHCALGLGRAACLAAAYLIGSGRSLEQSLATLRRAQPRLHLNAAQVALLEAGVTRQSHKQEGASSWHAMPYGVF